MFLFLKEIFPQGLPQHGEDAIVGQKEIVSFAQLAPVLVLGILFSEGCEREDFFDG